MSRHEMSRHEISQCGISVEKEIRSFLNFSAPFVKSLREHNPDDFPEAFCDVTTALLFELIDLPTEFEDLEIRCGTFKGINHLWLNFHDINIDFTAHQFKDLEKFTTIVKGEKVLLSDDCFLEEIGFLLENEDSKRCQRALKIAAQEILSGVFGDPGALGVELFWNPEP